MMADDASDMIGGPRHEGYRGALPPPHVEVVSQPAGTTAAAAVPWHRAWRMRVFLSVFVIVLAIGLAWDFSRPAQYRATASLLTEVPHPASLGEEPAPTDVQHVAIQGRLLLRHDLLAETLRLAGGTDAVGIDSPDALAPMLSVTALPDTNLVELSATGANPERLAVLVNAWIAAYQALRQQQLEQEVGDSRRALEEERATLAGRLAERRGALDDFRARHDIVTLERDGNEALARLKALTADLNRARDEAVEAQARLQAIEDAISRGDPVVPPSELGNLEALEEKAAELRGQLIELKKRFTPLYLENEPGVRVIPAQLADIEARIEEKRKEGREVMLVQARQEVEQAQRRVKVMEADLVTQKEEANRFTTGFARYAAMGKELEQLESLSQETESRLAALEAQGLERYPPVQVIEGASPPASPYHPRYWRDAAWVLLAAFAAALSAVLLLEFLTHRPRTQQAPAPVTGIRVFVGAPGASGQLPGERSTAPALEQTGTPMIALGERAGLPDSLPRELIPAEVGALWALADPMSKELMALLLSGLTLEECGALTGEDFDLQTETVRPPSEPARTVQLAPSVAELFAACRPLPLWGASDGRLSTDELALRIGLLAHDAGLAQSAEVSAAALRHTYIAYLVRQGARLTELERVTGALPAAVMGRYVPLSPAGPAKPISQLELVYPVLR